LNDVIEIQCPNCGGTVRRKPDEYFAVCPYCNAEVGFDVLKEEAEVTGMRSRLEALDRHLKNEKEFKSERARRKKQIQATFGIATLMYLLAAVFAGLADEDSVLLGVGVILLIVAFAVYFTSAIVFSSSYSVFNDDKGAAESNKNERFKMWLRLTGICLLLIFFATIAAMLICVLIEHTA